MNIDTSLLNKWSDRVKDEYINSQIDPTDEVRDIVEENDLNYKQAQRLCEASNLAIKRELRNSSGPDDVQFPLVSIKDVFDGPADGIDEVDKEASLRPESFLDRYSEYFLSEYGTMKKEAELTITCDKLATVIEKMEQKAMFTRRDVTASERAFEKVAHQMLDYLDTEARAMGSVNESYTAVSMVLPQHKGLTDRFYKYAQQTLAVDLIGNVEIEKRANRVVNKESEIVKLFEKYASCYDAVHKSRVKFTTVNEAKKKAEAQLRNMILSEG